MGLGGKIRGRNVGMRGALLLDLYAGKGSRPRLSMSECERSMSTQAFFVNYIHARIRTSRPSCRVLVANACRLDCVLMLATMTT